MIINLMPVPKAKAWKYMNGKPEATKAAEHSSPQKPTTTFDDSGQLLTSKTMKAWKSLSIILRLMLWSALVAITSMFPYEESLTFKKPGSPTAERLPNQHEAVRQRTVLLTQFLASHLLSVLYIFHNLRYRRTIIEREKQTEIDAFVNGNVKARASDADCHCAGFKLHVPLSWD
ncbi:hypothetical protein NEUTE2DRAFT_60608 [Neurospora tetrasperma FGSC 2509]|nr:hypothetical protein NEUTE2DRAFT_60608 [Neurospora tetrasperma FGSC 2509]